MDEITRMADVQRQATELRFGGAMREAKMRRHHALRVSLGRDQRGEYHGTETGRARQGPHRREALFEFHILNDHLLSRAQRSPADGVIVRSDFAEVVQELALEAPLRSDFEHSLLGG